VKDLEAPPNTSAAGNAGIASWLAFGCHLPGVPEPDRSDPEQPPGVCSSLVGTAKAGSTISRASCEEAPWREDGR
jgi:hypothetical protein